MLPLNIFSLLTRGKGKMNNKSVFLKKQIGQAIRFFVCFSYFICDIDDLIV